MYRVIRISPIGQEPVVDLDTVEEVEPAIRCATRGNYLIEEIRPAPQRSDYTSRHWGVAVKRADGSVGLDPW